MLYTWLSYLIPILGLITIGVITILKNSRQRVNVLFFLTSITIALWLAALFIGDLALHPSTSLWAVRGATFVGTLIAPLILYLGNAFPMQLNKPSWKLHAFAIIPSAVFMATAFTPLLIPNIEIQSNSVQVGELGLLYTLQSFYLVSSFVVSIVIMLKKRKRGSSRERSQIKLVMAGLIVAVLINAFTGLFLTVLDQANNFSNLAGAISFVVFVGTTSYAIVRYRLFDIRLAVTRVIGYSITIGIIAAFYSLFIILFSAQLTFYDSIEFKELLALLAPAIFVALTFHKVERFIARHTQRIFYRDNYDEREILDKLSDELITENDIDKIMQQSLKVLESAIKPSTAYLAVLNTSGVIYHHVSLRREAPLAISELLDKLPKSTKSIIDREENPTTSVAKIMAKDDVEILLRLGSQHSPTGLLLLGAKRNGTMYTKQDITLLRISAKNLSMSLNNAKKYEQILHFADTLHKEVKRATSRLRKANEELKTLDALKDDFIATASHQLRTPAASVHDAIRMLNHPSITPKDRAELINMAEASSEHLVTVVRTMLNMARLQAGHFTIDKSEAELVSLTEKLIDQIKVLAAQKDSTIHLIKPSHPIVMQVDVAKINEAFSNYIENAIKYSPASSVITVSLIESDGKVVFEVADQGMGVPQEEQKNLFGKFYRATNARQKQPDGNGIGLYVVKCIAEGHGGEAYYRPAETGGSVFGLNFPTQTP